MNGCGRRRLRDGSVAWLCTVAPVMQCRSSTLGGNYLNAARRPRATPCGNMSSPRLHSRALRGQHLQYACMFDVAGQFQARGSDGRRAEGAARHPNPLLPRHHTSLSPESLTSTVCPPSVIRPSQSDLQQCCGHVVKRTRPFVDRWTGSLDGCASRAIPRSVRK